MEEQINDWKKQKYKIGVKKKVHHLTSNYNHHKIINFLKRKGLCLNPNGKVSKPQLIYAYDCFLGTDLESQPKNIKWYEDFAIAERNICERLSQFKQFATGLFGKEEIFDERYEKFDI